YTVALLTPVCLALSSPVSFCSLYRNLISLFLWSGNEGLPPFRPLARAASNPFFVRSLNKLASSSANALIMVKNILPIASLVDTFIMNVSTKDAMGKMFFTMMSAFAELEANLLSERTKKGLEAARARGRKGGRPSLPDHKKREIKFLYNEQKLTGEEIAKKTGVSRSTVYRIIKEH